jgi:hypothetical protein
VILEKGLRAAEKNVHSGSIGWNILYVYQIHLKCGTVLLWSCFVVDFLYGWSICWWQRDVQPITIAVSNLSVLFCPKVFGLSSWVHKSFVHINLQTFFVIDFPFIHIHWVSLSLVINLDLQSKWSHITVWYEFSYFCLLLVFPCLLYHLHLLISNPLCVIDSEVVSCQQQIFRFLNSVNHSASSNWSITTIYI